MLENSASDLMFGLSKTEERPDKMCTGEECTVVNFAGVQNI